MATQTPPTTWTCTDVILAYQHARAVAGEDEANKIIGRFGAQYAATVPPQHYATAIDGLNALARHFGEQGRRGTDAKPTDKASGFDPDRTKARRTRQAPAER